MPTDANRPRKMTDEQIQADPTRCGYYGTRKRRDGTLCGARVIPGTKKCKTHAGVSKDVARAKGAVVLELKSWGLGDSTVDPGEVLLRLVTQSAWRAERYAAEVQRMVTQAGSLQEALTGESWSTSESGGSVKVGEYIRAMAKLESDERDRCANFATKAVAAGLAERQVRLAEQQGAMLASVIKAVLDDLGLTPEQAARVPEVAARHLRAVAS